ncbi:ribonuclease H-like domain-containing protein [Rhizophagus clarus]|uniref:ribonuclease H n=1 Tax=Rhizophagus clarus TaxID=94130 RepID=A0A8H3KYC1_9GLOM|nr:ribonuclease H-like domain-containing protein [Rhizophagus clarus]
MVKLFSTENEHPVLEIKIDKLEIEIIQNRISSTILQDKLIQHHDNMTKLHINELHIYTDGSLNLNSINGYNQIIMGAGWIVKNTEIDFTCEITYFPSSTRPELLAILTALLTVPINNNTHIYTDSQSAIDSINNMLQLKGIIERKLFKQNNYILLYAIVDLVYIKKINLILHKVKGHSGCIWNDKADKLAKKESELALENKDRIVDLKLILNNSNFEFIPKWSEVCIDKQIRKFCAQISDAIYEANWSCNKYWSDIFIDQHKNWYWDAHWETTKRVNHFSCNFFKTNDELIHIIKCQNNLLSTIDNLKHRLNIYNNLLCPICNKEEETLKHLTICEGTQENFEVIENQIITKILKIIKKHNLKNNISYNELKKILFKYKDEVTSELKEKNRVELTRELISSSIMMNLQQKTSRKLSKIITNKTINLFHKFFRSILWKQRCEKMQQHERDAGISQAAKKRNTNSIQILSPNTQTNNNRK